MREMKESGVNWIGAVPAAWQTLTIGSLFKVRNEKVNDTDYPPLSVSKGGIVPQMENVAKSDANDNRKMVLQHDFVINSRSDRKQSCGVAPKDGSVSLINTVLYPANGAPILPEYPNFLMKNYGFAEEFYRWGHGIVADLWTTRWQEMKSILLPIPTVEEQRRILQAISVESNKVDALITNVEMQIEKLKVYKQSLITEIVTKGLDPTVPMKDSGVDAIGLIPKHWEIVGLSKVFSYIGGYAFNSNVYVSESNNQVIRIGNIKNDHLLLDSNPVYVDDRTAESAKAFVIQPGMILFTMTGTKGKRDYFFTHLVTDEDLKEKALFINQRVGAFVAKRNICRKYFC